MRQLPSRIASVTVFRRGARVTRVAELEAEDGAFPAEVEVPDLPLTLEEGSLRLSVVARGSGETPRAVSYRLRLSGPPAEADAGAPDASEFEAATLAHARAEARVEALRGELERLQESKLAPRPEPEPGQPPPPSPLDARLTWMAWVRTRSLALHEQLQSARETLREATMALERARERHEAAQRPRPFEARKIAVIRLEAPESDVRASAIALKVSYDVPGARWLPAYALRLTSDLRAGQLEMRAMVAQASGEDWSEVALALSTALPDTWTELPELKALRIGRAQPMPRKAWRKPIAGTERLYDDRDRAVGRPAPPPPRPKVRSAPPPIAPAPAAMGGAPEAAIAMPAPAPLMAQPMAADAPGPPRGGGMPSFAAKPVAMARQRVSAAPPMPPPPPPPTTVEVDRSLLDYGRLRMFPAHDPRRGALRRVSDTETTAAEGPLEAARALERRPLPPGFHEPIGDAGFAYTYRAEAPCNVPSRGTDHPIAILATPVTTDPTYVTVPREDEAVFRLVRFDDPWEGPILPGPIDVVVDGRFLQTAAVELTPARAPIELGLGVEPAIKVARNVVFQEDTAGLLKRQHELEHHVRIRIANHLPHPAKIEVRERIPVPAEDQREAIAVEIRSVTPAWADYRPRGEALRGGRQWRVDVPPGGERQLEAVWVIVIPAQHEIVGGNRREQG